MIAAITPQAWIARCAGVQKVSRPIERCQETSHAPPILAEVTARAPNHTYQGTRGLSDETCANWRVESGVLDIKASQFWRYLITWEPPPPPPFAPAEITSISRFSALFIFQNISNKLGCSKKFHFKQLAPED